MQIDVIMPTWNSNSDYFKSIILSMSENLPLCHLIVIDKHSTDGTLDVIKENLPKSKLIIVETDENLAQARKIGIEKTDTDWFAFIDSDIEICRDWFTKMWPYARISEKVGAIQAIHYERPPCKYEYLKRTESLKLHEAFFNGLFNLTRGLTTQTLVRKNAVSGWDPPRRLAALEDYDLTQHILQRGYDFVRANDVFSLHKSAPSKGNSAFRWGLWCGAGVRMERSIGLKIFTVHVLGRVFGIIVHCTNKGSMKTLKEQAGFVVGFMNYGKFLVHERKPLFKQMQNLASAGTFYETK